MEKIVDIEEIIRKCEQLSDPVYLGNIKKMVPTDWKLMGVTAAKISALANQYKNRIQKPDDFEALLYVVDEVFERKLLTVAAVYLTIVGNKKKFFTSGILKHIEKWATLISDWAVADSVALTILSNMLVNNICGIRDLLFLKGHSNIFAQRMYIVSFVLPLRKGSIDFDKYLEEIEYFAVGKEKSIYKAVSWVLREGSKSNKGKIAAFLKKHRQSLHSSVVREVEKKLKTGKKSG